MLDLVIRPTFPAASPLSLPISPIFLSLGRVWQCRTYFFPLFIPVLLVIGFLALPVISCPAVLPGSSPYPRSGRLRSVWSRCRSLRSCRTSSRITWCRRTWRCSEFCTLSCEDFQTLAIYLTVEFALYFGSSFTFIQGFFHLGQNLSMAHDVQTHTLFVFPLYLDPCPEVASKFRYGGFKQVKA